jgi:proton-dependent oligopeptide transporter, POT family
MSNNNDFFKQSVLGHPAGLFVLFFTEMWERFSYYGMRAILVLFLTSSVMEGGWAWPRANALALYGTYTSMVYLTPILGGYVADKLIGHRKAVLLGALIMTIGHASMAFETPTFLYLGILCLILGNGFFKPNMTSIVSQMYKDFPEKKDGAYSIFYMGVNAGSFFGILLCGYLGEEVGWSYGFGLAGIFMFFGMCAFYLFQNIFGDIGLTPKIESAEDATKSALEENGGKLNPFTSLDKILMSITAITALVWIINNPISKIYGKNIFGSESLAGYVILGALLIFLFLLISRILRYSAVTRDRMFAVCIIAFFYMLFWASFEQAGGSMTIFASDYVDRSLTGDFGFWFKIFNTLLTVVPLCIITWVLFKLFGQTSKLYTTANLLLSVSFVIIWGIVIWMLYREFNKPDSEIKASWFSILNSFFIITLAPLFSKLWDSKFNPPGAFKYALGLILLGIGFGALAYGASDIPLGAKTAGISIIWLIIAYFFHTMAELCISPVGLSYVSKLVPGRMIAIMFGIWYLSVAIGNKLAGTMGSQIDTISAENGLSYFFKIFTFAPFIAAVAIMALYPVLKKLMHGVK